MATPNENEASRTPTNACGTRQRRSKRSPTRVAAARRVPDAHQRLWRLPDAFRTLTNTNGVRQTRSGRSRTPVAAARRVPDAHQRLWRLPDAFRTLTNACGTRNLALRTLHNACGGCQLAPSRLCNGLLCDGFVGRAFGGLTRSAPGGTHAGGKLGLSGQDE